MTISQYRKGLHCLPMAARIEANAKDNLQAWCILGQSDKYQQAMQQACILRHAETLRTITDRREYLNAHGIFF